MFTTECGSNYIGTKSGGVKEPTLTHHTMGQEKTMEFITGLILQHIKEIGEGRVCVYGWGLEG